MENIIVMFGNPSSRLYELDLTTINYNNSYKHLRLGSSWLVFTKNNNVNPI